MRPLKIIAGLASVSLLAASPTRAETQTENVVAESRTSVSLHIAPEAAQLFLPQGWIVNSATGPNLTAIFMDRTLQLTPDGKPLGAGTNRLLVLAMAGKNLTTGEVRSMIVGGYSADPASTPGAYKVYRPGTVSLTRTERKETRDGVLTTIAEEHWTAQGVDGATVTFDIAYVRGPAPALRAFEQKNYSGAEPDFYRIYRGQQASETLRGQSVDHVHSVSFKAQGGDLGKAVNGKAQIIGISTAPVYSRLTFLP